MGCFKVSKSEVIDNEWFVFFFPLAVGLYFIKAKINLGSLIPFFVKTKIGLTAKLFWMVSKLL